MPGTPPVLLCVMCSAWHWLLQARLQLSGVLELLLATYSLSGDRTPPATPLYSGDEAQIREALADVILAHAAVAVASAAAAVADQQQAQVQQALGALHEQLQCLPQAQQLIMQVSYAMYLLDILQSVPVRTVRDRAQQRGARFDQQQDTLPCIVPLHTPVQRVRHITPQRLPLYTCIRVLRTAHTSPVLTPLLL